MPLKNFASKAFPRRKSSGNALDDFDQPSEGFRVMSQIEVAEKKIEQQHAKERSKSISRLSAVRPFASPAQKARQQSFEDDHGASNRYVADPEVMHRDSLRLTAPKRESNGSSSTGANSRASARFYDSSSARFSSSSTLPSSTELDNDDLFAHHKPHHGDSRNFSIRGAARTFTFGGRNKSLNAPLPKPPSREDDEDDDENLFSRPTHGHSRDRSLTTNSSASTAHPPRVDTSLSLGMSDFGGGFDDLFAGMEKRRSPAQDTFPKPPPPVGILRSVGQPFFFFPLHDDETRGGEETRAKEAQIPFFFLNSFFHLS